MNPNKNIIKNEKIMKRSYENAVVDIMLLHIRYHWKSYISRKTLRGKITFCYLLSLASLLLQDSYCCWLSVGLIRSWD